MHRSLYEKVRKKVMNEQRKTKMNTSRALYNKLICVFICAESTVGCFNVHLHWTGIAVANYCTGLYS